jgi:ribosomal protein S21
MSKSKKHQLAIVPGNPNAVIVNGNLDFALKLFKRQVKDSGIMDLMKERKEFKKKSVVERENYRKARFLQQKFSERERKN